MDKTPTNAVILQFPIPKRSQLTVDEFEAKAGQFLRNTLAAAAFLELCEEALHAVGNHHYAKTVYKYRYLAHISLLRLYDAFSDALTILNDFDDKVLHCQMMCTIALKRKHYTLALAYVEAIIEHAAQAGTDASQYELEKIQLAQFIRSIPAFSARTLSRRLVKDKDAIERFSGMTLQITGLAEFAVHQDSQNAYIVFDTSEEQIQGIYCQVHRSELPFIAHLRTGNTLTVVGVMLGVDKKRVLLNSCHVLL